MARMKKDKIDVKEPKEDKKFVIVTGLAKDIKVTEALNEPTVVEIKFEILGLRLKDEEIEKIFKKFKSITIIAREFNIR
jgi:hypothetical protein